MNNTDLRAQFSGETGKLFNVEWIAYNDYAVWLESKLIKKSKNLLKLLTEFEAEVIDIETNSDISLDEVIENGGFEFGKIIKKLQDINEYINENV